jgi:hypothetical protein
VFPSFVHRQLFGSTPLSTVRKTNAVDCTLSLEPLQPFMQGKASRNILTLRLISLLDSFYFPSEQFIHCAVCKPVNSPLVHRLGKPRCLSVRERAHQPTIKIRDSADSNGPRTKFALPAADPSHLSSQAPRADSRCRSSAGCPASCLVYNSPHVRRGIHPVPTAHINLARGGVAPTRLRVRVICINPRHLLLASNEVYSASCRHSRCIRKWYPLRRELL